MSVKTFFQRVKAILQLVSKVSQLVGDFMVAIEVVDTIVDTFIEKRKRGELKDVTFLQFLSALMDCIGEIANAGIPVMDICDHIVDIIATHRELLKIGADPAQAFAQAKELAFRVSSYGNGESV